jgi:hypothetical protein
LQNLWKALGNDMDQNLTDEQEHVWEILSSPYYPPTDAFDGFSAEQLTELVNAVKAEMAKKYEIR